MRPKATNVASAVLMLSLGAACPPKQNDDAPPVDASSPQRQEEVSEQASEERRATEQSHRVVFAERTSQGYLLLVEGDEPKPPPRKQLKALVQTKLGSQKLDEEVSLLLALIDLDPDKPVEGVDVVGVKGAVDSENTSRRVTDLLGLHISVVDVREESDAPLIPLDALGDPVLTRELDDAARSSLADRRYALLLRADYRNQNAVRGLRLLQTLVRIVAGERKALIHDPDTRETLTIDAFTRRRLQSSLGNVADQVAVVPFPDKRHGEGHVRLTTRGMRRFGSPDIELDGLPKEPVLLQKATHMLYGLAFRMIRMGEVDRSGFAIEIGDTVSIHYKDVAQAYMGRDAKVPRCKDCPEEILIHLVERPAEPHDPREHVVTRVVAPRAVSDRSDYDQSAWARKAVAQLLGE